MKNAPNIIDAYEVVNSNPQNFTYTFVQGRSSSVPARPLGLYTLQNRLKCAWLVFTGKADVLYWKGQE